ncbi:hypothetical protein [Haloparvum sp. AD34]
MPELNRRATLHALAGVTAGATAFTSPTKAKSGVESDQTTVDRPDVKAINNRDEAIDFTVRFTLNGLGTRNVDLQLDSNESRTISKVKVPKTGVYSVELQMDGKIVDSSLAEAPDSSLPPYLSIHIDVRENDAFVTTSEV